MANRKVHLRNDPHGASCKKRKAPGRETEVIHYQGDVSDGRTRIPMNMCGSGGKRTLSAAAVTCGICKNVMPAMDSVSVGTTHFPYHTKPTHYAFVDCNSPKYQLKYACEEPLSGNATQNPRDVTCFLCVEAMNRMNNIDANKFYYVSQPPNSNLCGQACVAMVARIPLYQSIQYVGTKGKTRWKSVGAALLQLGFALGPTRFTLAVGLPPVVGMHLIRYGQGKEPGHFAIWCDGFIHDPAVGHAYSNNPLESRALHSYREVFDIRPAAAAVYDEAVVLVRKESRCAVSLLQRRLSIGYERAFVVTRQMIANRVIDESFNVLEG